MRLNQANLLVVDDEPALRHLLGKWLTGLGCGQVHSAADGAAALHLLETTPVDLLITDVSMPVLDGVGLVRCMALTNLSVPSIVFISGYSDVDKREMHGLGVEAFVTKPFEYAELLGVLESSLAERSTLWRSELAATPTQSMSIRVKAFAEQATQGAICLGRGGFSAVSNSPLRLGRVSFRCSFEDGLQEIAGQGYVRWKSPTDQTVGIEFGHLHDGCHSWLTRHIAECSPRSFIPQA